MKPATNTFEQLNSTSSCDMQMTGEYHAPYKQLLTRYFTFVLIDSDMSANHKHTYDDKQPDTSTNVNASKLNEHA